MGGNCGFHVSSEHLIAVTAGGGCRMRKVSRREMSLPTSFPKWQQWILPKKKLSLSRASSWEFHLCLPGVNICFLLLQILFFSFKLAISFSKYRSRFHPWIYVNYSALTITNHLALPNPFVVFERKKSLVFWRSSFMLKFTCKEINFLCSLVTPGVDLKTVQ